MIASLPVVDKGRRSNTTIRDLGWYDYFLVSFSGGKDSIALALSLRKRGVPANRIVLMYQHVDGGPGVDQPFMDCPAPRATAGPSPRRPGCGCSSSGGTGASTGR